MKDKERIFKVIHHKDGRPMNAKKINRNDTCACGSGKKAKKCCGCETIYGIRKVKFE